VFLEFNTASNDLHNIIIYCKCFVLFNLKILHNLCVACTDDVLVNTEDMAIVAGELRKKINNKIRAWARTETPSEAQEKMVS